MPSHRAQNFRRKLWLLKGYLLNGDVWFSTARRALEAHEDRAITWIGRYG